ncbi:MAG TPA: hypothetical protein VHY82_15985 [Acetobacteraceae bacterium]|jgi:hypothetical protein|nr:hypothetical protein [Acetobacteraceae bacterium]
MRVKYEMDACVDCLAFIANGDVPEDRPDLPEEIAEHMEAEDLPHIVYAADGDDWFSWSPCECCGSRLGGNRNRLDVLTAS